MPRFSGTNSTTTNFTVRAQGRGNAPSYTIPQNSSYVFDVDDIDSDAVRDQILGLAGVTLTLTFVPGLSGGGGPPEPHAASHKGGGTDVIANATTSLAGLMSSTDKTKIDTVATGATATPLSGAAPVDIGTTSAGSSSSASRADHIHAHGAQAGGSLHSAVVAAGANGFMTGADKTKLDGVATGATNVALSVASPLDIGTTDAGTAATASRADHVHAHGNLAGGTFHAAAIASGASGFLTGADKAKLDGVATGATNTALASTAPVDVDKSAAVVGSGATAAKADHKHDISTAAAVGLTDSTNAEGNATSLARSNHTHGHGNRAGGSLHADVVAAGASGFMTGADKTKLDGVATGATNTPLSNSNPANVGTTAAPGSGTSASKDDHVHDLTFATWNAVAAEANASISVAGQKITNLADPTSAQDAATQAYVLSQSSGGNPMLITGQTTTGLTSGDIAYVSANNTQTKTNSGAIATSRFAAVYEGTSGTVRVGGKATVNMVAALTPLAGQPVYLSTTAGQGTNVKPSTNVEQEIGIILDASTYAGAQQVVIVIHPKATVEHS